MVAQVAPQLLIESYYPPEELQTATQGRRLAGYALDLIIFVLLAIFTLTIGWWIWFAIVARNGQSPAKRLLGLYTMRDDGSRAGGWYTWLREVVVKWILFYGIIPLGLPIGGLWCTWDQQRQCLWDKLTSTYIAYSPNDFRPLTAQEMRERGQEPPALTARPPVAPSPRPAAGTPTAGGAAERLRELQRLHDEGLITDEQFAERQARIVEDL